MIRSSLVAMVLAAFVAVPVAASEASLAGNWQLKISSPQGTRMPSMSLVQRGNELSGTYHGTRGEVPIEGRITGSQFELTVKLGSGDTAFTAQYRGRIDGDALSGKVHMGHRGEAEFTGQRQP